MANIINLHPEADNHTDLQPCHEAELVEIADGILLDTRASLENKTAMTMPIAQLATLGAGVASLLPAFRTVTQTTTVAADGLYRLANAGVGDALKVAKNGNFWGAFKTADGASKFAQLQAAGTTTATSSAVMPIDPATLMMAVALFSIEQKLGSIAEMQKQIFSFLAIEQEAEIEADIETLSAMMTKYKYNWDNEHFIASNHKLVLDIQRTARKHLNAYQKQVTEAISGKKLFVSQSKVNEALTDLLRKFKYYRLTMYTFSMASFIEIMLSGDFKEENIRLVKEELEKLSANYRDLFGECSVYLERLSDSSVETNVLKGLGAASKAVGRFIDGIPKIREGQVDEFLLESGTKMQSNADRIERKVIEAFAEISNPGVWVFVEKLNDMIQIYGRTTEICFDDKQIYLIAG
ncbi:MAG: hypothetical protein E7457_00100 [Ruminococcaceae bacterium]|nr:hypothetical protein [Oscillospiraceae bacterium]